MTIYSLDVLLSNLEPNFSSRIRDTKEKFHAKMGTINDINGINITEAEDVKKRCQEYTEELYKKIFMTKIITMV